MKAPAAIVITALAAGCAGGGGGSKNSEAWDGFICVIAGPLCPLAAPRPSSPSQTTSTSNVRTQMDYTVDAGGVRLGPYLGAPDGPFAAGEVQVRYDAAGRLELFEPGGFRAMRFASLAGAGLPWLELGSSAAEGAAPSPFAADMPAQVALVANASALGWSYQSFGVWNTATPVGGAMHASAFGVPTPAAAVPTSGSATFAGKLAGLYVAPSGEGSMVAADVSLRADFHARTLAFASSRTVTLRGQAGRVAAPGLDLSGTLAYQPGANAFSGTLRNAAGTLGGTTSGKFHGPAAEELGGVFALRAPGSSEALTGAYGAKR